MLPLTLEGGNTGRAAVLTSGLPDVTLTNTGTAAVDARVTSAFGSTDVNALAAGKAKSVSFAARSTTVAAGSVTATTTVNATPTQDSAKADYAARSCG